MAAVGFKLLTLGFLRLGPYSLRHRCGQLPSDDDLSGQVVSEAESDPDYNNSEIESEPISNFFFLNCKWFILGRTWTYEPPYMPAPDGSCGIRTHDP